MDDDEILQKWYEAKEKVAQLEKRIDKYKKIIDHKMNKQNTNKLTYKNYSVNRRNSVRTSVCKADLPTDIWSKYCSRTSFSVFTVSKMK